MPGNRYLPDTHRALMAGTSCAACRITLFALVNRHKHRLTRKHVVAMCFAERMWRKYPRSVPQGEAEPVNEALPASAWDLEHRTRTQLDETC